MKRIKKLILIGMIIMTAGGRLLGAYSFAERLKNAEEAERVAKQATEDCWKENARRHSEKNLEIERLEEKVKQLNKEIKQLTNKNDKKGESITKLQSDYSELLGRYNDHVQASKDEVKRLGDEKVLLMTAHLARIEELNADIIALNEKNRVFEGTCNAEKLNLQSVCNVEKGDLSSTIGDLNKKIDETERDCNASLNSMERINEECREQISIKDSWLKDKKLCATGKVLAGLAKSKARLAMDGKGAKEILLENALYWHYLEGFDEMKDLTISNSTDGISDFACIHADALLAEEALELGEGEAEIS